MHLFKDSVEKRVIPSLQVFFVNNQQPLDAKDNKNQQQQQQAPTLDRESKNLIQATFGDFFQTLNINQSKLKVSSTPQSQQQQAPTSQSVTTPTNLLPVTFNTSNSNNQSPQIKPLMMMGRGVGGGGDLTPSNSFMPISNDTTGKKKMSKII